MIKRFLALSQKQRVNIVMWLYSRYVLQPEIPHGFVVMFEPDPAMDAQIEKNVKHPIEH